MLLSSYGRYILKCNVKFMKSSIYKGLSGNTKVLVALSIKTEALLKVVLSN